jgi:dTMP kinase
MAYQGYAQGLGREAVETLQSLVAGGLRPDLTLILDLPVEQGLARAKSRAGGEDRYEKMDSDFHARLYDAFHDIAEREPRRCLLIDATGDEDAVAARLQAAVRERLGVAAA